MKIVNDVKNFIVRQPNTILAIIGFILGAMIATEYSSQIPRIINPAASSIALDDMENNLHNQQISLKESLEAVDNEIANFQDNVKTRQSGLTGLVNNVEELKKTVGLTELSGEGVEIILDDADKNNAEANAIAHASDLRDLVEFLWSRGAQGISIEAEGGISERVIFSTSIDCVVNTVLINSTKAAPPFKVVVLGNRDALIAAVNDRVTLKSIYDRVDKEGFRFYTTENSKVQIPKYSGNINLGHVKIQ